MFDSSLDVCGVLRRWPSLDAFLLLKPLVLFSLPLGCWSQCKEKLLKKWARIFLKMVWTLSAIIFD